MTGRTENFQNGRYSHLFGAGIGGLQGVGPTAGMPFERARGSAAIGRAYDLDIARDAIRDKDFPVTEVDPRTLSSTQPSVTRDGVRFYMSDEYKQSGETYADLNHRAGAHSAGNKVPIVYHTEDGKENVILSGHHRATAALLSGQMLKAKVVTGPWRTRAQTDRKAS